MKTDKLARHYPALSPAERLSLMLAAAARGNDAEHARLIAAAPRVACEVPHTFGRALAFLVTAARSRMERLDLAALYFKASAVAGEADGAVSARCRGAARVFGYLLKIHADGWALFCRRERLDPAVCEAGLPGDLVLEQSLREAEADGFMADEARAHLRRDGHDPPDRLRTAESVADGLQAVYRAWFERWE